MIRLDKVSKIFGTGVAGLSDITLLVDKGEFVFLVGHTGSGKTTLLRLLVRDMLPSSGTIIVGDFDVVKLPSNKIPHLRKKVGVVFQDLKLLVDRTIFENIMLPMQVAGLQMEEAVKRTEELLSQVGLSSHKEKFPVQLSGGELQRVAIARALALSPDILLADEPTGNLDPQTAMEIVELLSRINEAGMTIIMATHNLDIVQKMNKRVVGLEKGKLVKDERKGVKHHEAKETKEPEGSTEPKESKELENIEVSSESKKEKEVEKDTEGSEETKGSEENKQEKMEGHKKETKKLSDLLAKARQTLSKKETHDKKEKESDNMPFGFAKDEDVKNKDKEGKSLDSKSMDKDNK